MENFFFILLGGIALLNLILLILIGLNIIALRELIQDFMEGPPISMGEEREDDRGLQDVQTSQVPYTAEPLIEED